MQQKKTVKEWLEMLPEPYKTQCLDAALYYDAIDDMRGSLAVAIAMSIISWPGLDIEDLIKRANSGEFDKPAIPWPEEAKWENAPDETFARAVDASGRCYFYSMAFMKTTSQHTTEVLFCGKISDMSNVQWKETLEYNPLLFKK